MLLEENCNFSDLIDTNLGLPFSEECSVAEDSELSRGLDCDLWQRPDDDAAKKLGKTVSET